jgi:aryl-alcohol dehydrogenase-like predicted oxidoreductase
MANARTSEVTRRQILGAAVVATGACNRSPSERAGMTAAPASSPAEVQRDQAEAPSATSPLRKLGKTGVDVEPVSLGGEGILRTRGKFDEAVPMIEEALRLGVRYCDTAPAYAQSQDYYGAAFRNDPAARERVFLASKTHDRTRDGALRLLDDSLQRLGTDWLDSWQLHDLRDEQDLDAIFGKGGAIEAVELARADGRIRHVGITGHHRPSILVEAMKRYPVDTVLCAINPADPARAPFLSTVVAEARARGIGIIAMKVMGAGRILDDRAAAPEELIRYAATHADTAIIGCSSIAEVRQNFAVRTAFQPLADADLAALERRLSPRAARYDTFKAGA